MSEISLSNNFISIHNLSRTPGVDCFRLKGGSGGARGEYTIVRDTRTHPLSVFANSTKPETVENKTSAAHTKLYHNIRDKFSETERPLVPRKFRTPESYAAYRTLIAQRFIDQPGLLQFEKNKPLYNMWPIWCIKDEPLLTLLLRIPNIFHWLVEHIEVMRLLMGDKNSGNRINWIQFIEDAEGQGPLENIGFRYTRNVTVLDLCPKVTTVIPFQEFDMEEEDLTTILTEKAFLTAIQDYQIFPPYAIVRRTERTTGDELIYHSGYTLAAWIDNEGTLYERFERTDKSNNIIRQRAGTQEQEILPFTHDLINRATLILYEQGSTLHRKQTNEETILRRAVGEYVPPLQSNLSKTVIIPFREPMSCTSAEIDSLKEDDYPVIVQPKLDGNRIIAHVVHNGGETTVKYYSRNGMVQSKKFNELFDSDVIEFATRLGIAMRGLQRVAATGNELWAIQLDCECYAHDVIHSEIGGWINRIAMSDEFRKLKLYILSWLDLNKLTTIHARGRDYTTDVTTFGETLLGERKVIMEILRSVQERSGENSTLRLNSCVLISNKVDMFRAMSIAVDKGFEGLVLYPFNKPYTFANAGLKKIKKFYDGEATVLSYNPSDTDPGAIGSVNVRTTAYFAKPTKDEEGNEIVPPMVTFSVTAALRQELKSGSMTSARFANCIGKQFTIICGSFSDTGIPIHARFKSPFGLDSERLDVV